jgi:Family of unknown function (DUF6982)
MSKQWMEVVGPAGHTVEIRKFEGPPQRGHLKPVGDAQPSSDEQTLSKDRDVLPRFEFLPVDGTRSDLLDWSAVKSIELLKDLDEEPEPEVRFFDSVEVSPYLWVRVTLIDGHIFEGRVGNSLQQISSSFLLLYPLDETANRKCVCVPRGSIANLQVVTIRH